MENERRRFKRFDTYVSVRCSGPHESEKKYNIGLTKDVSRDGVCINSSESLERGALIDMEIDLPDDPRPIRTAGKVVWTHSAADEEGTDYGIQFVTIDPVDKFRVLDYAYNHWLETKVNDFEDPEEVSEQS